MKVISIKRKSKQRTQNPSKSHNIYLALTLHIFSDTTLQMKQTVNTIYHKITLVTQTDSVGSLCTNMVMSMAHCVSYWWSDANA